MKVAITGAHGFVGTNLLKAFNNVIVIKRGDSEDTISQKLEGVDAVFNLAGAPIIAKWNKVYKEILFSSRIDTTKKLVNAINKSDVKHFISTSAIGAYPDGTAYDESFHGYADDFLGFLTKSWEDEALKCQKSTTILRYGIVLGRDGGAVAKMLLPFRLGLGGIIGDGKMMMSWIDIKDLVNIYHFILDKQITGVINAVSPYPVSNYELTKDLGQQLHRLTIFRVPIWVLKIIYGEGSKTLTASKEIYPKCLLEYGFVFSYPDIHASLEQILKPK
jgi:uncharacterized protein